MRASRRGKGKFSKRKDGLWVGRITVGWEVVEGKRKQVRRAVYGRTIADVKAEMTKLEAQHQAGMLVVARGRGQTVAGCALAWLKRLDLLVAEGERSPRTVHRYREVIDEYVMPAIGSKPLKQLRPEHVEQVMKAISRRGRSPRTINYGRQVMQAMLKFARREGWVSGNVAEDVEERKERPEVRPLDPRDLAVLLGAAESDPDGRLWIVSLSLGTRQSEVLGLTWDMVDDLEGEAPQVHIRRTLQWDDDRRSVVVLPCKTARSRRDVTLPRVAIEALRRQRQVQREARLQAGPAWSTEYGDLVFSGPKGEPLKGSTVSKRWTRRLKALGIPHTGFHAGTRHGAASLLAAEGVSMLEVSRTLGHRNIGTTADRYTDLFNEARRRVASAMDRALAGDNDR